MARSYIDDILSGPELVATSFGLGSDAVVQAAVFAGFGIVGDPTVTSWGEAFGLTTSLTASGAPTLNADGSVQTIANGATSTTFLSRTANFLATDRALVLFDIDYDLASDAASRWMSCFNGTNGFGFTIGKTNFETHSAPSTPNSVTLTHAFQKERFLLAALFDRAALTVQFVRRGEVSGYLEWSQAIAVQPADWKGQEVTLALGTSVAASGRVGTHNWHGAVLLSDIRAFTDDREAFAFMRNALDGIEGWSSALRRRPVTSDATYTALTAATVQAGNTLTRTSARMLAELTDVLTASGTTALPASPLSGDEIRAWRPLGGLFIWTVGGVEIGYSDEFVDFQYNGTAWVASRTKRREKIQRLATGRDSVDNDLGSRIEFTAASTYNLLDGHGASTGFNVELAQRGTGVVTLTLGGGLAQVPVGGPLVTNGDGSGLEVVAIGNSQVSVRRIVVDPSASSGEAVSRTGFDPTAVLIDAAQIIFTDTYTQTGAIVWAKAAGTNFNGGSVQVDFVATSDGHTWPASFVDGGTRANADLPAVLPTGRQTIFLVYEEADDVIAVYLSSLQLVSAQANNDLTANPKFWVGTQGEYDALTPTAGELYFILA